MLQEIFDHKYSFEHSMIYSVKTIHDMYFIILSSALTSPFVSLLIAQNKRHIVK